MNRGLLALLLAIVWVGGCLTSADPSIGTGEDSASGSSTTDTTTPTTATNADQILTLVNAERTSRGLSALTRNTLLDAAAQAHAADMCANGYFDHVGSDGSTVGDRATAAGYSWIVIGENIGQGSVSPESMMSLWMNSSGHRANILNSSFTELGVGIDDSGTTLWVQVFGKR